MKTVLNAQNINIISGMMDKTLLDWAAPRNRKILTIIYGDCKVLTLRKDLQISEIYNSRRPKI